VAGRVRNQLASVRRSRGIGAADLARRVGVSRQTVYAIEAGIYVPNTEVTLRLAKELEVAVEDLFSLPAGQPPPPESLGVEVLSATALAKGQPVRICRNGSRWISVPVSASPYYLPEADGVISRVNRSQGTVKLAGLSKDDALQRRLLLAGCDPATSLLAHMVEKISGVEIISASASSKLALKWLEQDKVHIAGSHLEDPETGEFNLPFIRRDYPNQSFTVITFARWEEGLVVASGNPKGIQKVEDIARKNVVFINRENGSGSRALLDRLLRQVGVSSKKVRGYGTIAYGHLAAAYSVASGQADCCLATRSAAVSFGLDFVPLRIERYDLVMRTQTLELPAIQVFLDVMQRATLRRKLELLAGYDTSETGALLA